MAEYKPIVNGIVAEFDATKNPTAADYQRIVQSRNLPQEVETALMNFAAEYWTIKNYKRTQPTGSSDFGIVGDIFGIAEDVLEFAKEMVIDPTLEILTNHTSDELLASRKHYLTQSGGDIDTALARRMDEVIRELKGK